MNDVRRIVALPIFLSWAIVVGCSDEQAEPLAPRAVRVMEIVPQRAPLISAEGSGQIQARNTSDVGFLVAGRLTARSVDVGTSVKAGELLARIDPTDFQNKLLAAQSQVTAAQSGVDQAKPQEERLRKLLADGFTTRTQYEAALRALQAAQAQLQSAEANLKLAGDQLKYTQLLAPNTGVVTATGADVGQVVSAGQMIVQIAQLDEREAVFSVSPEHVAYAHAGMPVKVWLQDNPSDAITGSIREIAPNADPVTGTYAVKVSLPNAPADMRLGAIVVGHAEVPGDLVVRVPSTALLQAGAEPQVWLVSQPDRVVTKQPVKVMRYDADSVVVSKGLQKGDLVVVAGVNSLAEGQKVALEKVSEP